MFGETQHKTDEKLCFTLVKPMNMVFYTMKMVFYNSLLGCILGMYHGSIGIFSTNLMPNGVIFQMASWEIHKLHGGYKGKIDCNLQCLLLEGKTCYKTSKTSKIRVT